MSSYNLIKKKQSTNENIYDNNQNIQLYSNQLKNLSIDLSNNGPMTSLNTFDIDDYNIVKSIG